MSQLAQLLPLVGIALIFWLLIIRPAQRRQKALTNMQSALAIDDDVLLTSGIHATVRSLDGDTVTVEIAPGVRVRVARGAIGAIVPPDAGTGDLDGSGGEWDRPSPTHGDG